MKTEGLIVKYSIIIGISLLAANVFGQAPTITNVLNAGIGDRTFAPMSEVYIYGSFSKGLPKDFSITVGGIAGYVSAVNSLGYITAILPSAAPMGQQPLVVSYQGAGSSPYPVTMQPYAPEFQTVTVVPVTNSGPTFPLANYFPIAHADLTPVTPAAPAAPGERLVSILSGMGPTNPPVTPGGFNTFQPLATQPVVLVGALSAPIFRAGSSGTTVEVDFYVPNGAPQGYTQVVLTVNGYRSNIVTIAVATQPLVTAVLNAGSFRSPGTVAPGSIISIFGIGFGPSDNLIAFPATNVNGSTVNMGGDFAPIFALATVEGQINAQVPTELPTNGTVSLTVVSNLGTSLAVPVNLSPSVPGIFFFTDPSVSTRRNAAALIGNSAWIAMPTSMAAGMGIPNNCASLSTLSTCGQPAHVGDVLQVFVTGLGKATPGGEANALTLATGKTAPASGTLYLTVQTPIVTIGGIPVPVQFSGIAPGFAGLYQINVPVPAGVTPGDDVPITVAMPGSIVDTATISVAAQ
jgi:uncharacterized protein (TIGR03437 family)